MNITLNTCNLRMNNDWWNQVFAFLAGQCSSFRVHCWNDEISEISRMKQFGNVLTTSWKYGVIVEGQISDSFIDAITSSYTVTQRNGYNMMTPFFTIELDNVFSSSHYGTEVSVESMDQDIIHGIDSILSSLKPTIDV